MSSSALRRGTWLGATHSASFGKYRAPLAFDPDGAFVGNSPLAAWCELYPDGAQLQSTHDTYTFGVYTGGSMAGQVRFFGRLAIGFGTLWGFDSFEGLPDPSSNEVGELASIADWRRGGFSAADALGVHTYDALVANISARIGRPSDAGAVEFVRGYYNTSLTPSLARARRMR